MFIVAFLTLFGDWKGVMTSQRDQSIVTSYALSRLCANEYISIRMCGFTRVNLLENDFPEIHTKREK